MMKGIRSIFIPLLALVLLARGALLLGGDDAEPGGVVPTAGVGLVAMRASDGGGGSGLTRDPVRVEVHALDPALPEAARSLWSRTTTASDGHFRLFCSDPAGCAVELRSSDGRSWSGFVAPGVATAATLR